MAPAILLDSVTHRYGRLCALDNISLAVEPGEIYGLIGPDGAGKSTVFGILSTLLRPTCGRASIMSLDTVAHAPELRTRIGYMPERFSLYPDLTVMENLSFFATLFGMDIQEGLKEIEPVFRQLARFPDRKAAALSGGMKQKLALSCALIHRPDILLLDEPTTGVDAMSRSEFWDILHAFKSRGMTIVVSTSYMDEATRCNRVAMLHQGHIIAQGEPRQLSASLDGHLFSARSNDMFALLEALRALPDINRCYTFGHSLHIVGTPGFSSTVTLARLVQSGITDATIDPAVATVEDVFINLTD